MNLQKSIALRQLICAFNCQVQNKNVYASLARQDSNIINHMTARITHKRQRWSQGHRARDQGQGHKKCGAKAKDSPSEERPSRGQGQECSKPRPRTTDTSASVLQKKREKKVFKTFFRRSPKTKFSKIFFRRSPVKNDF